MEIKQIVLRTRGMWAMVSKFGKTHSTKAAIYLCSKVELDTLQGKKRNNKGDATSASDKLV